jgi:hypothetical protein
LRFRSGMRSADCHAGQEEAVRASSEATGQLVRAPSATASGKEGVTPVNEDVKAASRQPLQEQTPGKPTSRQINELNVHVVDVARPFEAHGSIASAIDVAKPGDRIVVRPGIYNEGLLIDKPLEIIGQDGQGPVIIRALGKDAVLFQSNLGRISNLTLRQIGGGGWYGIDIAQGRLVVEACEISSESHACIAIHNDADPLLRGNRIHDGKQCGVSYMRTGAGL